MRKVLAHGCFDRLHLGHIRHLQEAKSFGDYLIVSITADRFVRKGIGRPAFTAGHRAEALMALTCVDEVIINEDDGPWDLIRKIKPAFYVKGVDYVGSTDPTIEKDRQTIEEVGGQFRLTKSQKWSSSALINQDKFSDEICEYLEDLKARGAKQKILDAFGRADEKRILFVGETIIDEYRYVRGLGRASKELMLATVETGYEAFNGGVVASAKHGEWRDVHMLTPTSQITKTRFVDADFNRKIFDVYSKKELMLFPEQREDFRNKLADSCSLADVVIVNDFGHGLITGLERDVLEQVGFLAVNCQTNAGNYGFNLVTKYRRADYVCIDEPEARLAASIQSGPMGHVVNRLGQMMKCNKFLVTHGRFGSHSFATSKNCTTNLKHPALVQGGVDTMGAGDAVLAVTAPLIASGLDISFASFVGNVVGAIKVSILGHRRHVGRDEIIQTVGALLA